MKITKKQLRRIIREEKAKLFKSRLQEAYAQSDIITDLNPARVLTDVEKMHDSLMKVEAEVLDAAKNGRKMDTDLVYKHNGEVLNMLRTLRGYMLGI
jgi:hypothetical protein